MKHSLSDESVSVDIRSQGNQCDLIDQAFFSVDSDTFTQFQALLDKPLPPTDKLRRLLKKNTPWDYKAPSC